MIQEVLRRRLTLCIGIPKRVMFPARLHLFFLYWCGRIKGVSR
jgi:hypothetical protein